MMNGEYYLRNEIDRYNYNAAVNNGKSSKHQKAEEYQLQGLEIEIIPEDVFYEMIGE